MNWDFFKNNVMVEETKKAKFLPHGGIEFLIFIGIFFVSQIFTSIVVGIMYGIKMVMEGRSIEELTKIEEAEMMSEMMLPMLFLTLSTIIMVIIYIKFIQKRSFKSIGFSKKHAFKDYLIGYFVGFAMFSAAIVLLVVTGNLAYEKATLSLFPTVIAFFIGFLIQGASEEIALRGYLMPSLAAKHNVLIAIIANSSIFGILHLGNLNVTFLSVANIILFGLFSSIYALKFANIWGVCAIHSAWNFVQGNVYGLEVSGMKANESLWHFKTTGNHLLNGGSFGPEGGLAVTLVLMISIAIVLFLKINRNQVEFSE